MENMEGKAFADTDLRFMRRALACAGSAAAAGEVPVGAVLVDEHGRLLAESGNRSIALNDPAAHAEILVLRDAGQRLGNYRLTGTTLYATLEPCPMCAGALVHARVARVVFATPDPRTGACGSVFDIVRSDALNHRLEVHSGLLADDSAALLKTFFAARRQQAVPLSREAAPEAAEEAAQEAVLREPSVQPTVRRPDAS